MSISAKSNSHISILLITLLISLVYIVIMFHGYYNLFVANWGLVAATLAAFLLTAIAMALIRYIAQHGGLRANLPLFVVLLLVSAVGVFNSLMLSAQGDQIFRDTAEDAAAQFQNLSQQAQKHLVNDAADAVILDVESLKQALTQEILNPVNCGEGPAAAQIIQRLKEKLPQFTRLSGGNKDCAKSEQLVKLYHEQIDKALWGSPTLVNARYQEKFQAKQNVLNAETKAKQDLAQVSSDIEAGKSLITQVRPQMEIIASNYRDTAQVLRNFLPRDVQKTVPERLNLTAIRSLGDPWKFLQLIGSRITDPLTWFFLVLAICADTFLIFLFGKTHSARKEISPSGPAPKMPSQVNNPWE